MGLFYIFIVSLLTLGVLVFAKYWELKTGKPTFVNNLLSKCDPFCVAVNVRIQHVIHNNRERAFFLFLVKIPSQIEAMFSKVRARMHDYYHGTNEKMRNKRNISRGTVSPYMRSMTLKRDTEGY